MNEFLTVLSMEILCTCRQHVCVSADSTVQSVIAV